LNSLVLVMVDHPPPPTLTPSDLVFLVARMRGFPPILATSFFRRT
jgi:hypothetical protein